MWRRGPPPSAPSALWPRAAWSSTRFRGWGGRAWRRVEGRWGLARVCIWLHTHMRAAKRWVRASHGTKHGRAGQGVEHGACSTLFSAAPAAAGSRRRATAQRRPLSAPEAGPLAALRSRLPLPASRRRLAAPAPPHHTQRAQMQKKKSRKSEESARLASPRPPPRAHASPLHVWGATHTQRPPVMRAWKGLPGRPEVDMMGHAAMLPCVTHRLGSDRSEQSMRPQA
jgi:hypothetical protein